MTRFEIFVSVLLISILASFHTAAAEVNFTTIHYRFDGPPTYCIVTPSAPDDIAQKWIKQAQNAIQEWKSKLQMAEDDDKSAWEMDYLVVKKGNKIPANCSVELYFLDTPPRTNKKLLGSFSTPPAIIEIYTLQLSLCFLNEYCFKDGTYRSTDSIYTTILHEIGHSLGLDHYVSDNVAENYGWTTYGTPPSIMIPTQHAIPSMQKISSEDIQKIRSIYGQEGFFKFSQETQPTFIATEPIPEPITPVLPKPVEPASSITKPAPPLIKQTPPQKTIPIPLIPESKAPVIKIVKPFDEFELSNNIIKVAGYEKQFLTISGKISKDEYLKGTPLHLTIDQPGSVDQALKITTTKNGYFQTLLMFDKNSKVGEYNILASYSKHLDKDMNIIFKVSKVY